eukprot:TRINITY_DN45928_c0_g1_i1.p1 TRINITY_DN45928_c0_g1~~TRINITY_DN45928_c0_g1_i1.p1  ORF type:complete len:293 (+),score=33.83 TRINITY_DN45928_c0_g1_i1:76-954(+)
MSTAHYGRAVPLALRRFRRLPCEWHLRPALLARPPTPAPSPQATTPSSATSGPAVCDTTSAQAAQAPSASKDESADVSGEKPIFVGGLGESRPLDLPGGIPSGVHVVLLFSRLKHIEHADSWLSVREAWERLLAERGVRQEGEMQMYICCLLPRFWPLRWLWRRRMGQWSDLLGDENPCVHILSTTEWAAANFYERMHLHDDGRAYALVLRNDGEIVWGSHDTFKEHLQEHNMVRVVNRECEYRIYEQERVLEGRKAPALEAPAVDEVASSSSRAEGAARDRASATGVNQDR